MAKTPTRKEKQIAYLRTFCGEGQEPHVNAEVVLADLRKFCGLTSGGLVVSPKSGMTDIHATVYKAALRDVYLRIVGFLSLEDEHLFQENAHDREQRTGTIAES